MIISPAQRPLKVSILVSDLSKSGAGRWGGAVRTFLLARALEKLGYEVEILGFVFGDTPPDPEITHFPLKTIQGSNYPQFFRSAGQLMQAISGDILYPLRPKATTLGIALWKKWQSKKPIILDIDDWELGWHGGDEFNYPESLKQFARDIIKPDGSLRFPEHPFYLKWMEKLVSRADIVTIHTQFLQHRFGGIYVPNGKDTELFDPQHYDPEVSRKRHNLQDYRLLMFPGAPRPYKGVEDILMALDRLNWEDLRLVIVGGSPYDDYDRQLKEKWGRWIISLPPQPAQTMPEIVSAAHIIVVPQRDNPVAQAQFPLKLTDGMAMAKPIISTRIGDIPNILGDTGFLVDPSSPQQIATQIEAIFQNYDEAIALGCKARERCVQYYSLESMAAILKEAIANLINP
jgi:glycosyltransferase involved in cell wall biosynthesis